MTRPSAVKPSGGTPTAFDRLYSSGISRSEVKAKPARVSTPRAVAPSPVRPRLAAGQGFALGGCVLTPDSMMKHGWVVVGVDGKIAAVSSAPPQGVQRLETEGVILPGLIDLHGHPEFNVFAAWEPPKLFINRQQWRGSDIYRAIVRDPWNRLQKAKLKDTMTRYAEIRALVGGTTAIQGASPRYPTEEALVRNVDKQIFGRHHARSMIDLPSKLNDDLRNILAGITSGDVTAFYVHVAEGRHDNLASQREFGRLTNLGALTSSTVIIHGTALTDAQLGDVKDASAKLVWSPQSNLRLYAETTNVKRVVDLKIPMALGADWLPSGSRSLLDELRVARRQLALAGAPLTAKQLVQMVTKEAAEIAGLGDELGVLKAGRVADVLVLERRHDDPWENVLEADPSCVELVLINGDLSYGRAELVKSLVEPVGFSELEAVPAWGKPMVLDTAYAVNPRGARLRLRNLRASMIEKYPQVGPIFG